MIDLSSVERAFAQLKRPCGALAHTITGSETQQRRKITISTSSCKQVDSRRGSMTQGTPPSPLSLSRGTFVVQHTRYRGGHFTLVAHVPLLVPRTRPSLGYELVRSHTQTNLEICSLLLGNQILPGYMSVSTVPV